jgi:hypothetical protein
MMRWLELWAVVTGASLLIGAVWLWLERKWPPHSHDEGEHDPRCPGCFAERMRH